MRKLVLLACILTGFSSFASKLTEDQKLELYRFGTITTDKGIYTVHTQKGDIAHNLEAIENILMAREILMDFKKKDEFWKNNVSKKFWDGVALVKKGIFEEGIFQVPSDFSMLMLKDSYAPEKSFGKMAYRMENLVKFVSTLHKRTVVSFVSPVNGAVYAIVKPSHEIVKRPLHAGYIATVKGMIIPAAKKAWNWMKWFTMKEQELPEQNTVIVTFEPFGM